MDKKPIAQKKIVTIKLHIGNLRCILNIFVRLIINKNDFRYMKHLLLYTLCILSLVCPSAAAAPVPDGGKPFVIPELKSWTAGEGDFETVGKLAISVPSEDPELLKIAECFSEDWKAMFGHGLKITAGNGDIIFMTDKGTGPGGERYGQEGYSVDISIERVIITAPSPAGIFWATRTLLQMADNSSGKSLPAGRITDWPDYGIRGFMMDCGRKYIPMGYLKKLVRIMAYYKMNTLQIHLNDNGFKQYFGQDWDKTYAAFRLESEYFPGLTARDGSYGKEEFRNFQNEASGMFVEIIPEIDVPAHSLALTRYRPETGSEEYGMDHLDLFSPATYSFLDSLFTEYLEGDEPVFTGPKVHIGTDEYSNRDSSVVEKFREFTDHYIRLVESYGKQAVIWGALTHADGKTPVKSENVLMNAWYNGYADPEEMVRQGYRLISIPDGYVYIVPAAGYYYDFLNERFLYESWTPAHVGETVFEECDPAIAGGMFAVWNDHAGNGISVKDIHYRLFTAMQTLSAKMWSGENVTLTYDEFDMARRDVREAPGINENGRIGAPRSCVLAMDEVSSGQKMPYGEIGYDYTVNFTIEGGHETPGTELFRSDNAVFYLSDPISGMLGFARDGYLNTFRYRVHEGEKAEITVKGDCRSTTLIVNGKTIDRLEVEKRWHDGGKSVMYYVPTLVFPLGKAGDFDSRITDFEVFNYTTE